MINNANRNLLRNTLYPKQFDFNNLISLFFNLAGFLFLIMTLLYLLALNQFLEVRGGESRIKSSNNLIESDRAN